MMLPSMSAKTAVGGRAERRTSKGVPILSTMGLMAEAVIAMPDCHIQPINL